MCGGGWAGWQRADRDLRDETVDVFCKHVMAGLRSRHRCRRMSAPRARVGHGRCLSAHSTQRCVLLARAAARVQQGSAGRVVFAPVSLHPAGVDGGALHASQGHRACLKFFGGRGAARVWGKWYSAGPRGGRALRRLRTDFKLPSAGGCAGQPRRRGGRASALQPLAGDVCMYEIAWPPVQLHIS